MKRFIAIWILLSAGLNIWQMDRIRDLEEKKPMVVYKADYGCGWSTVRTRIYENPELLEDKE